MKLAPMLKRLLTLLRMAWSDSLLMMADMVTSSGVKSLMASISFTNLSALLSFFSRSSIAPLSLSAEMDWTAPKMLSSRQRTSSSVELARRVREGTVN